MLIYLISLPIWNFVLPTYAFWKFDDFSWGDTRKVEGEAKGGGHGEEEGLFDSSMIVMKRWGEFEKGQPITLLPHISHSTILPRVLTIYRTSPQSTAIRLGPRSTFQ